MPLILTTPFRSTPTYREIVLSDSPTGYWMLQETSGTTAIDETGTQNGTYTGTYTQNAGGPFGTYVSAEFNGGGYVNIPGGSYSYIGASSQPYTFEVWVRPTDVPLNQQQSIVTKTDISPPRWNTLQVVDLGGLDLFDAQLFDGTANPDVNAGYSNEWSHVVVVRNVVAGSIDLYVDTGYTTSGDGNNDFSNSVDINLGTRDNGADRFFVGRLAHVAVYNYALSPTQISEHYNAGLSA